MDIIVIIYFFLDWTEVITHDFIKVEGEGVLLHILSRYVLSLIFINSFFFVVIVVSDYMNKCLIECCNSY